MAFPTNPFALGFQQGLMTPSFTPNAGPTLPTMPGAGGARPMGMPPFPAPQVPGGAGGGMPGGNPMQMLALAQALKQGMQPQNGYRQIGNGPFGVSPGGGGTYTPPFTPAAGAGGGLGGILGLFGGGGGAPGGGYPGLGGTGGY